MPIATTYNTAGDREDLTNALTILTPEDCPKTSTFPKSSRPSNAYQEWQLDTLLPVNFSGVLEGQDVSSLTNQVAQRARVGNYIQKFLGSWAVSREQEASMPAGVADEVSNSKTKCLREIKRSIEACIGSDNDRQQDNGAVPYKTRALGKWINTSPGSDVPSLYATPTASIDTTTSGALSESNFNDVFTSIFQKVGGRRSYTLFAGPLLKRTISNFQRASGTTAATQRYMVTQDATQHQIDLNVSIYEGDFHTVTIVPDLFNGIADGADPSVTTTQQRMRGYVIDPDLVGLGYMYGIEQNENPDLGGGRNGYIRTGIVLMVKNPLGLGKFAATS